MRIVDVNVPVREVWSSYGDKSEPRLMKNGKAIYLGLFKTLAEAVKARETAEKEHFTHES